MASLCVFTEQFNRAGTLCAGRGAETGDRLLQDAWYAAQQTTFLISGGSGSDCAIWRETNVFSWQTVFVVLTEREHCW